MDKQKPKIVKNHDIIDLPKELQVKRMEMELAINILFINNEAFLYSIDQRIKCSNLIVLGT